MNSLINVETEMEKELEHFRNYLANFESNVFSENGLLSLENASYIYDEVSENFPNETKIAVFNNLFDTYADLFNKKAEQLFNSVEIDNEKYHSLKFLRTSISLLDIFEQPYVTKDPSFCINVKRVIVLSLLLQLPDHPLKNDENYLGKMKANILKFTDKELSKIVYLIPNIFI